MGVFSSGTLAFRNVMLEHKNTTNWYDPERRTPFPPQGPRTPPIKRKMWQTAVVASRHRGNLEEPKATRAEICNPAQHSTAHVAKGDRKYTAESCHNLRAVSPSSEELHPISFYLTYIKKLQIRQLGVRPIEWLILKLCKLRDTSGSVFYHSFIRWCLRIRPTM